MSVLSWNTLYSILELYGRNYILTYEFVGGESDGGCHHFFRQPFVVRFQTVQQSTFARIVQPDEQYPHFTTPRRPSDDSHNPSKLTPNVHAIRTFSSYLYGGLLVRGTRNARTEYFQSTFTPFAQCCNTRKDVRRRRRHSYTVLVSHNICTEYSQRLYIILATLTYSTYNIRTDYLKRLFTILVPVWFTLMSAQRYGK